MNVHGFIRKEVSHQGFDLETRVGQERVRWMHDAWTFALLHKDGKPTVADMLNVGFLVEPEKNIDGYRKVDVRVGTRICPPWQVVPDMVEQLWGDLPDLSPLEFYLRFETIHPFVDGNGRTGKVLLCWLNGTLDDPEMPPDLFGEGVP